MGWFDALFGRNDEAGLALYSAIVARARQPHWYVEGAVPDTVDGRFDMIAAVLTMVLLRLESDPAGAALAVQLTERFIADMDGQLRELGVGDVVVGKHVGQMMAMLGGRLGAYRDGLATGDMDAALVRNLYRGAAPDAAAVAHVREALLAWRGEVEATSIEALAAGEIA